MAGAASAAPTHGGRGGDGRSARIRASAGGEHRQKSADVGVPGGAGLRKAIYESKSAPEILSRVEEFFEARLSVARDLELQADGVIPVA